MPAQGVKPVEGVFKEGLSWDEPWDEIYFVGLMDEILGEDSLLPSFDRSYANQELYPNPELLKRTAGLVLEDAKKRFRELEQKVLAYQPQEKKEALRISKEIADGTSKGRILVDAHYSDSGPCSFLDELAQLKQAKKYLTSDGYREHIRNAEIITFRSIEEETRYVGLVKVIRGLTEMLNKGVFVPEIIGKHFHNTYQEQQNL